MSGEKFNFEEPANIPMRILQGATFHKRWRFRCADAPFPFYSPTGVLLWKGRCMAKETLDMDTPNFSLTSADGGVIIDTVAGEVFYGLYVPATQTAKLPPGKLYYDVEFERLSDGWVIRPQKGTITVEAEVTR